MKFLIDECLSDELTRLAIDRGHRESSHVRWLGKAGVQDWNLLPVILAGDWTFVTKNSYDFRGPTNAPGAKGEYRKADLHAGLICLNGPVGMNLDMQLELFEIALDQVATQADLINQVLEITLGDDSGGEIRVTRYEMPEN
jgi:hypothetical protein